jgi:hypothetical protein
MLKSCILIGFLIIILNCSYKCQVNCQDLTNTYLESIDEYECTRKCDSHFTGGKCWQKTFKYFTNELLKSIISQSNSIRTAKRDLIQYDQIKFNKIMNDTFIEYNSTNFLSVAKYNERFYEIYLKLIEKVTFLH